MVEPGEERVVCRAQEDALVAPPPLLPHLVAGGVLPQVVTSSNLLVRALPDKNPGLLTVVFTG